MSDGWTQDRVLQLAPDAASAKAGQGLASVRKWVAVGRDDRALWGECQGSGSKPYQVSVDLAEVGSKCSCPSRKFPCKHALGLMLMFAAGAVGTAGAPTWVEEWLTGRAERSKKKQEKAEAPPKPVDAEAQAERREKRLARVGEGLAALRTWCEDLVRGGIAALPAKGYAFFDEPARRMIDAQAPGVGRRVQLLGEIAAASAAGWQRPFVEQLASTYLLTRAFERLDALDESSRQDVLATLGLPVKVDDPGAAPPVRDAWHVLAQEVDVEDRLRVQRTWLIGRESRRPALVLAFAHGTSGPLDMSLAPGTTFDGELAFYPGNGVRAEVKTRGQASATTGARGFESLDELCDWAGATFAAHPWVGEIASPLHRVTPARAESGWVIVDEQRRSLPARMDDSAGWLALAIGGGRSCEVVAAYDGRRLRPLTIRAGDEQVSLRPSNPSAEVGR